MSIFCRIIVECLVGCQARSLNGKTGGSSPPTPLIINTMNNISELIIQNLKFHNPDIDYNNFTRKDCKEEVRRLIKQIDIVHMFLIEQCDMLETDMEFAIGDISTLLRLINNNI